jgi:hypothetical protein
MTAPASNHQAASRATLIIEREYAPDPASCVAAVVKLLTYHCIVNDEAATSLQDVTAGDRVTDRGRPGTRSET